jgi:hypothetical protein
VLDPFDRVQLVNELRPPDGFEFDYGIGTTFSVDLETLLTVPLSLALCEFESRDDALANPEALIEGLRRIAGKLHIFCHRTRIKQPNEGKPFFSFLEEMVMQALPRNGTGAFHPKVWVLRYRRDAEMIVRVLVLSRNLTFDKSWDTALILEGEVQPDREREVRKNRRLAHFVRTLADLSGDLGDLVKASLNSLAADVMRVEFKTPDGFNDFAFWPLGIGTNLPEVLDWEHSRVMVISPFLSELSSKRDDSAPLEILLHQRSTAAKNILVSRPDQLDALKPESITELQTTTKIYVLDDAAVYADETDGRLKDKEVERPTDSLSGLHAKVYVVENGPQVSILTGSANATHAGWGNGKESTNVEFVVELIGTRAKVGINALLGNQTEAEAGAGGLLRVLKPYNKPDTPPKIDPDLVSLENKIDAARQQLAVADIGVEIVPEPGGNFGAILTVPPLEIPDGIQCDAWPVMLPQGRAQPIGGSAEATIINFDRLSIFAVTPFWVFRLHGKLGKVQQTVSFVLRLPLEGMPEGRAAAIMSSMINSSDRFLRYLALLLSDDPAAPGVDILRRKRGGGKKNGSDPSQNTTIVLESLIYAYSRNPKRLERIEALLTDLKHGATAAGVIPPEFDDVWQAFRQKK